MSDQSQPQAGHEPEKKEEQVPAQAEAIEDLEPEKSEDLSDVQGGGGKYM
jgi:hypothetical protein